jgi:hypothetical protein
MPKLQGKLLFWVVVLIATPIDLLAFFLLEYADLGPGARLAAALLPLPGNIALFLIILRAVRKLDEFQQRLQLEAVAAAFLSTAVAVFIYGYLQKGQAVGPLHPWLVYVFMFAAYGVGYLTAVVRYR